MRLPFTMPIADSSSPGFVVPASAGNPAESVSIGTARRLKPRLRTLNFLKPTTQSAFTLLEVILACALFFMFAFAVLQLVTRGLHAARMIQQHDPDGALILGPFSTNRVLEPMSLSGDFEELYPGIYPGYNWTLDVAFTKQFGDTNPVFQVTVVVTGGTKHKGVRSVMTTLMFAPDSKLNTGPGGIPNASIR